MLKFNGFGAVSAAALPLASSIVMIVDKTFEFEGSTCHGELDVFASASFACDALVEDSLACVVATELNFIFLRFLNEFWFREKLNRPFLPFLALLDPNLVDPLEPVSASAELVDGSFSLLVSTVLSSSSISTVTIVGTVDIWIFSCLYSKQASLNLVMK
jgi:hypothetical protein